MDKKLIDEPPHYTGHPSGVECVEIAGWFTGNLAAVIKYVWRRGQKGPVVDDLEKAKAYLGKELDRLKGRSAPHFYAPPSLRQNIEKVVDFSIDDLLNLVLTKLHENTGFSSQRDNLKHLIECIDQEIKLEQAGPVVQNLHTEAKTRRDNLKLQRSIKLLRESREAQKQKDKIL